MNDLIYNIIGDKVTEHFWLNEVQCKDSTPIIVSPEAIRHWLMMEEWRVWYNRTVNPTSWDRSKKYNTSINGSPTSKHMLGLATDFLVPKEFAKFSEERKREFVLNCMAKWKEINIKWGTTGAFYVYRRSVWQFHLDSRTEFKFKWGYLV